MLSGPRLDHRCTVLRCCSQSVPLTIVKDNLYRYVMFAAVLGSLVYNTCALYPFHPFISVLECNLR